METPLALIDGPFEYDVGFYNRLIDRAIEFTPQEPEHSCLDYEPLGPKDIVFGVDRIKVINPSLT